MTSELYSRWLELAVEDADLTAELLAIRENPEEIHDRFYRGLEFGTGGLRGKLGAGTNRMNIYVVRQATRGLAGYLLENNDVPRVAISYDSRHKSRLFATEAAKMLGACGIEAHIFDKMMPTPALSFAVRQLRCGAGIMITASHNPAIDNGYKVYDPDGCQITDKAAKAITRHISAFDPLDRMDTGYESVTPVTIPEAVCEQYYQAVLDQRITKRGDDGVSQHSYDGTGIKKHKDTCDHGTPALPIVYTPLHGSGIKPVTTVLADAGFTNVSVVPSQSTPDGDFPTCPFPNPELPGALSEGMQYCTQTGADLLLATDPDCDRVGVAVPNKGGYRILSGNEIGILLLDYICKVRLEAGTMPERPIAIKTIVTTGMADKIAAQYGVTLINVLTGFKYIGEYIGQLEQAKEAGRFIFGFEESCGYLSGTHARDKDAVNACLLICDMAQYYAERKMSLIQQMELLYQAHGYTVCALDSFGFDGEQGTHAMREMMRSLRDAPPDDLLGFPVRRRVDYLYGDIGGLPRSDVLQYTLGDKSLLTIRPSGTEPKMKVYYQVTRTKGQQAQEALAGLRSRLQSMFA